MSVRGHENKFRLGWHACHKRAANRATNWTFFQGLLPPIFGGAILHPPFLNFGPGGNALKLPQVSHILLVPNVVTRTVIRTYKCRTDNITLPPLRILVSRNLWLPFSERRGSTEPSLRKIALNHCSPTNCRITLPGRQQQQVANIELTVLYTV